MKLLLATPAGWAWPVTACLASLLLLGACQAQPGAAPAPSDEAGLLARIKAGIGDARCSSDAQCRTVPIGEKACGGPEAWWAWSSTSAQADKLPGWATELAALARQRNQRSGMMSNCMVQPDPGAVCQAQRCVLVTAPAVR